MVFAQMGFGIDKESQFLGESQRSFQDARCYSPTEINILSCNTEDSSISTNTGANSFGQ